MFKIKDYVILRSYETGWYDERKKIKAIQNFGIIKHKKPSFNFYNSKYEIFYFYDELLNYSELENILKECKYELKDYINDSEKLLKLILNNENLKNKLSIVLVFENIRKTYYEYPDVCLNGSYDDVYNSINDIKNIVYRLKMKRIF